MKCGNCDKNEEQEPHICPFYQDVHGEEVMCVCCEECEHQCARDI